MNRLKPVQSRIGILLVPMFYTKLSVSCPSSFTELLIAELTRAEFETFLETDDGFEAYAEGDTYDKRKLQIILEKYQGQTQLTYSLSRVEQRNWNEEWEKSFSPISVEDKCLIRASFHQADKVYPYEIIITPKMSFGTGHHQTTWLMVRNMLHIDHADKRVIDAGCGTAILSILASKMGAREVEAFDIDDWSVENANENIRVNNNANVRIQLGKIATVQMTGEFDIVLANINKNVLLDEMQEYASRLRRSGLLLISGFFTSDIEDLLARAQQHKLAEVRRDERENWAALLLQKTE